MRKQRRLRAPRSDKVQARESTVIPPGSLSLVPVTAHFLEDDDTLYVERVLLFTSLQGHEFYGAPDTILRKNHAVLPIANFSDRPVRVEKGEVLGIAHNPRIWLDKAERFSPNEQTQIAAHAALLRTLASQERSLTVATEAPDITQTDDPLAEEPMEGGPKTSEIPPDDTPKESLVGTVDVSANLNEEQRVQLMKVIQRNEAAFALDGRLGMVNAECTIPLRPGSKEISLPPFPSSPAKREVI
ncbi:hypothetical protein C2E23DRAFT_722618, partial [Lenzites betulinus]